MSSFDYTRISDPAYIEENRLPAHSDHIINGGALTLYLNGLWKFHYAKNYASTVPGFWEDDYDASGWDDITVPAHIQLEGYDVPQYANVQYPWDGLEQIKPGEIPQRFNPVGSYVRSFTVPEDWRGMGLRISFQGVESAFALWVNGRYVGYGSDGFTPSDFDITDFTRDGENKLAVQVFKFSAGSWLEDQDFFRFSGIFRDVLLQAVPSAHIEDVKVETIVSEDLNEAVLRVGLNIRGEGKPRLKLMLNGVLIAENELPHSDIPVHNPKLWSAEDPVLYELLIELFNSEGQLIETVNQPVGFRRFELKGSLMCLNGQRIEFRGVNRHEFHPLRGRTLTTEDIETDLKIMKRLNINAVRTSHYPNQSVFYALCDKLGLYVIDETNLETHGIWDGIYRGERPITDAVPGDKPEWKENVLSRANAMYQRDKNHPCVLIWSCGNEAFGGSNIYEMSKLFRRLDPSRLVHYEGIANDRRYPGTSDMESRMYVPAAEAGVYLDEHRDKPYIMCEYAHAMGNSLGAVYKYTELAEREPLYQGGFIWDFADQALWAKDHYGRDYLAYGGDLGDRPTDYHFCGNGIVLADRSLTPMAQEVKYVYQAIKVIPSKSAVLVKNRNLFISTEYLDCIAILEKEGHKVTEASIEAHVPPMGELLIDLPFTIPAEPGEYCLTVSFRLREDMPWAEKGYEVAFGQYIHKNPAQAVQKIRRPLNIVEGYHNFGVTGKDFNVLFSKTHGGLTSYKFGGREFITAIPKPHFWRALLPNDKGNQMAARHGVWLLASRFAVAKSEKLERLGGAARVTYVYHLPWPECDCEMSYLVTGDGVMEITVKCQPPADAPAMPEFGLMMLIPPEYSQLEWYGDGPAETACDRRSGAKLGIFKSTVKESMTPYLIPQDAGNKTGVRWASVTDKKGQGLLFEAAAPGTMEFSALPHTPYEIENAAHHTELPPVTHTVVRASLARMGVGGDDGWGARPHPEHMLPAGVGMEFTVRVGGIL